MPGPLLAQHILVLLAEGQPRRTAEVAIALPADGDAVRVAQRGQRGQRVGATCVTLAPLRQALRWRQ